MEHILKYMNIALFNCMYKFHHVASCRNSSWVQGNSTQKYIKENPLEQRRLMCAFSQEHTLLKQLFQQNWKERN